MDDREQRRRSHLAATLETDAQAARQVADRLEALAEEIEPRLDLVVELLVPATWAGAAAAEARRQAHTATGDLATAAHELRALVTHLRADARAWQQQAGALLVDQTGALLGDQALPGLSGDPGR